MFVWEGVILCDLIDSSLLFQYNFRHFLNQGYQLASLKYKVTACNSMDLLNYCWFGFKRFFGKIGIDIDEVEHYCIWDKPGQGHKQDTRIEEALVWLHAPAL